LDVGVHVRHAPVLAHMLAPRLDKEPLDNLLRVGCVLRDTPRIRAIAPPLLCEPIKGAQEGDTVFGPDLVGDRHDHGSAVMRDGPGR
jgi:hypothetical protein